MFSRVLFWVMVTLLFLPSAYAELPYYRMPTPPPVDVPRPVIPMPTPTPPSPRPSVDITTKVTEQISRSVNSSVAQRAMFANLIIPELKVRNFSGQVRQLKLSVNRRYVSFFLEDGSIRVWDFNSGVQRSMILNQQPRHMALDEKQRVIFIATPSGIDSYDILTSRYLTRLPITNTAVNDMDVSSDGLLLISAARPRLSFNPQQGVMLAANSQTTDVTAPIIQAQSDDKIVSAWDSATSHLKWQQSDFSGIPDKLTLAPDNRYFSVVCHDANNTDVLEIRELSNGKKVQSFSNPGQSIIFSQFNPDSTIEVGYSNGETKVWNVQNGALLTQRSLDAEVLAMDKANNVYAYLLDNGSVLISNAQGDKLATIAKENNPMINITLLAQGKKLMTTAENGQVFLWNVANGAEMLQLISTQQGWTVVDNAGRFDGSEPAMPNVYWQAENKELPIDNTSNGYYEPGLLASALNDDRYLNAKPFAITQGIVLPPKLQVSLNNAAPVNEEVELTVDVYDQGGGIDTVNIYHNNKVVNAQRAVISEKTTKEQDQERRTLIVKIKPTAGKNQVKASASNKMGLENQSNEAVFNADIAAATPTLRIATIGINQYSDKQLNLDYSVADAESIERLLTQKQFSRFSETDKKQLYDQNAQKAAILAALRELSLGKQHDVLAVYLAGHGISINGEWYFLPYETRRSSDLNYLANVGISSDEIREVFKDSTIQHILLMIDSCYSGASLESFRQLQTTQRRFSRSISRSVGITIVTATRKDQQAAEISSLGHGLFTYVLGKGMRGEADFMPQNNQISAHELANFSVLTIPEFSKRYIGAAQDPSAFTMGQDFMLFDRQ